MLEVLALIESRPKKGQAVSDAAPGSRSSVFKESEWVIKLDDDGFLLVSFMWGEAEVLVMEDLVGVLDDLDSWDGEVLFIDFNVNGRVLDDEWNLLVDGELLDLVNSALFGEGDFVWDLDLGGVWNLVFFNIWDLDLNLVWSLVVDGHWEFLLGVVGLLFVLGDLNLGAFDVGDLLDDSVVNADGGLIWHLDLLFPADFVDHSVWHDVSDNVWDLVGDGVGDLSAGDEWNLNLDLEWHLSLDLIWNLDVDDDWLKGLDVVLLLDIVSHGNLVWDLIGDDGWDLLGNLVFLGDVLSDFVSNLIS